jgi:hypothetical protein
MCKGPAVDDYTFSRWQQKQDSMTTQDKTTENCTTVPASVDWVLDLRLMEQRDWLNAQRQEWMTGKGRYESLRLS